MPTEIRLVTPTERLMYLALSPLFRGLPTSELAVLAQAAHEHHQRRGGALWGLETRSEAVHVVVRGRVRVTRNGKPFRELGPRDSVGLVEMLANTDGEVRAVARTRVHSLAIDARALFDILEQRFSILSHLLAASACAVWAERGVSGGAWRLRSARMPIWIPERPLDLAERLLVLERVLALSRGNPRAALTFARRAYERRILAGENLWPLQQPVAAMVCLFAGVVGCNGVSAAGPSAAESAGLLGAVEMLAEAPPSHQALAQTEARCLVIDRETLLDVFEDHFDVAADCLASLNRERFNALSSGAAGIRASPCVPTGMPV